MSRAKSRPVELFRAFLGYRRGSEHVNNFPTRIWLESSSRCNLACPACPNKDLPAAELGDMPLGFYQSLITQMSGKTFDLNLFHRGEALLHPDIAEMIAIAKQNGLHVRLHTNATLLDPAMAEKLIAAGLDWVSFSFDGYDRETYERNRKNASFEQTVGNIRSFLELKKSRGLQKPSAVLQIMEIGYAERGITGDKLESIKSDFLAKFSGLPLDRVVVRVPHNWGGRINIAPVKTGGAASSIADSARAAGLSYSPCTFLWYSMTILQDGRVTPCPQDFFGEIVLGDLKSKTIEEVWNDAPIRKLRRDIVEGNYAVHPPCAGCDRLWRKTFLGIPLDYFGQFVSDNILGFLKK